MDVHVLVTAAGPDEPPPGTPVIVEIRDTSLMDVASTTISTGRAVTGEAGSDGMSEAGSNGMSEAEREGVGGVGPDAPGPESAAGQDVPGRQVLASVDLTVPDDADPRTLTVWARVATSDHEHLTAGDWITVQAYPVQSETVVVEVVQV